MAAEAYEALTSKTTDSHPLRGDRESVAKDDAAPPPQEATPGPHSPGEAPDYIEEEWIPAQPLRTRPADAHGNPYWTVASRSSASRIWAAASRCALALPLPRRAYSAAVAILGWIMTGAFVSALIDQAAPESFNTALRTIVLTAVVGIPLGLLIIRVIAVSTGRTGRRK